MDKFFVLKKKMKKGLGIMIDVEIKKLEKDLHSRIQSDEVLNQSEKQYRNILSSIEDGYYEVDIAGNLIII